MADFEINIPASAVKLTQKGDNMAFTIGLNLTIGGNVTVSGGATLTETLAAVAASSNGAFLVDPKGNGLADGAITSGAVISHPDSPLAMTVAGSGASYDAATGLISKISSTDIRSGSGITVSGNKDFFFVADIDASLSEFRGVLPVGQVAIYAPYARDGDTSTQVFRNMTTGTIFRNGVLLNTSNRDTTRDAMVGQGLSVYRIKGTDVDRAEFDTDGIEILQDVLGSVGVCAMLSSSVVTDEVAATIEAELAAYSGITL